MFVMHLAVSIHLINDAADTDKLLIMKIPLTKIRSVLHEKVGYIRVLVLSQAGKIDLDITPGPSLIFTWAKTCEHTPLSRVHYWLIGAS